MESRMPEDYLIQPGDELEIKFFYHRELNDTVSVRPDGRISLILVNEVMAADKTPAELTEELSLAYDYHLKQPVLTVIVRSFTTLKAYVGGEVRRPRLIPVDGITTVFQAVMQAEGLLDSARTKEIVLIRRQEDFTPQAVALDLSKVIDGTDMTQDVVLKPFDIVYVPKSPIGNLNMWVRQYIRDLLPVETRANFSYRYIPSEEELQ